MAVWKSSREIFVDETERKPNLYSANVLAGVITVLAVVSVLNELGVFSVDRLLMRLSLLTAVAEFCIIQFIVHRPAWLVHPASKYVIMGIVLLLVLICTVLLNVHAVLAFVLPMLLAPQYRSKAVSRMALIGACGCCGIAPILSYLLHTWSLNFLTGYIQTFCRVTVTAVPAMEVSLGYDLWQIMLYWSMPQMLTLGAFGVILFSVTKSGIDSVNNQMQVSDLSADLNRQLDSIQSMQERMLCSMSDMIENRDVETGGHVRRSSEIVRLLTEAMLRDPGSGVTESFCRNVIRSAPMHDLGKIAVPDAILRKPGPLTAEEYETVKLHPQKSAEIIAQVLTGIEDGELLTVAERMAKYHHERMDGTGYPEGLKGETIPLEARIMSIADVYDALVSERCYKASLTAQEAFDTIENAMGTQFDPGLNRYFIACREKIEAFYQN